MRTLAAALTAALLLGCQTAPKSAPTTQPFANSSYDNDLDARVTPPPGWKPDPLKESPQHTHRVWLSPTGHTAYGIIHFKLPLPVGTDLALWGFLREMRKSEGEATLLAKTYDNSIDALRFTAQGGLYLIRTNLFTAGFQGWAIYAGTLRKHPINPGELKEAETARESSRPGSK